MTAMAPRLRTEHTQPRTWVAMSKGDEASIARSIRRSLEEYLGGRKLVEVKVRQVEGSSVDGFLKIEGRRGERLLVDFTATTHEGALSSLQVGGKRISVPTGPGTKRTP
jgi:hypothetical protein